MTIVAGPLGQLDLLAAAGDLDQLADEHLDVVVHVVAGAGRDRPQPVDVAVVVGAEQVDAQVEAARALVDVVGGVGGEVGVVAVGLDEDAVLVVAEVRRAQPHGPVELVDVTLLDELLQAALDRTGLVERPLGVPDVEVRPEEREHLLLLLELEGVGRLAERDQLLVVGQVHDVGLRDHDRGGEVEDVAAVVAVLGHGPAVGRGHDRRAELVHLDAAVVDVELRRDRGAGRRQHAGDGIAHRRPPGVAEVEGPGRVGGDELDVDDPPGQRRAVAPRRRPR